VNIQKGNDMAPYRKLPLLTRILIRLRIFRYECRLLHSGPERMIFFLMILIGIVVFLGILIYINSMVHVVG